MGNSEPIIQIEKVSKTYASGLRALEEISLTIHKGEIFALLGPNGAGKTTLIGVVCGLVNASSGRILADGCDVAKDPRGARAAIGLVPQELSTDMFETVRATVSFSRGLFGKPKDPAAIEKVLRDLSLWDKRDTKIKELSGGMKRRVLIAKALAHGPRILFLDEPTAGVDVALRHDMWRLVKDLRATGVTIILTTHYIEEAEQMADRIGVIDKGALVLVEEKKALMKKLGKRQAKIFVTEPLREVPAALQSFHLEIEDEGRALVYAFSERSEEPGLGALLGALHEQGIALRDVQTRESSLEDIFVNLIGKS